jgi:hypothetical protein
MNARERLLLVALIAVVGFGGFGVGTYMWFVKPLLAFNKTIKTISEEKDLEEFKWNTFVKESEKLKWARLKSLPMKPENASSEYENYLERMIAQTRTDNRADTGLKLISINSSPAAKVKPSGAVPGVKEVGHLLISFTLTARGELSDLVKLMELMQATPYEHRIKAMNVDRVDQSVGKGAGETLNISMVIETLLVAKNQNMPGHPPGIETKYRIYDFVAGRSGLAPMGWGVMGDMLVLKQAFPTPEDRQYEDIGRKNIFVGWLPTRSPTPPPPPETDDDEPEPTTPPPGNIPAYIRLVQTVPTHQEAYLLNLYYGKDEYRLSADPNSGYQTKRIQDKGGDYIFFMMKVLRVDTGVVYFQIEKHVFAIKLGQTLNDAIQDPLSLDRMDDLDLEMDREWGKEQMKKNEKEKTPAKKTGKGR